MTSSSTTVELEPEAREFAAATADPPVPARDSDSRAVEILLCAVLCDPLEDRVDLLDRGRMRSTTHS